MAGSEKKNKTGKDTKHNNPHLQMHRIQEKNLRYTLPHRSYLICCTQWVSTPCTSFGIRQICFKSWLQQLLAV